MDREEYVRSHPIRARILALYEQDEQRPLSLDELLCELSDEATLVHVLAYHHRVLNDAGLLPRVDA
jgi:hypothetical protein